MKVNFRIESSSFCYVFNKYKIEEIKGTKCILPEKNATKRTISVTENIDELLIEILNIGKKFSIKNLLNILNYLTSILNMALSVS